MMVNWAKIYIEYANEPKVAVRALAHLVASSQDTETMRRRSFVQTA